MGCHGIGIAFNSRVLFVNFNANCTSNTSAKNFDFFLCRLGPLSDYPHSCDHYPVGTCHQDEIYDPNILVANRQAELALLKREIESKTLHEIITRILEREQFINDNSMSMEEDLSSGYSSLKSSPNSNYGYQPEKCPFIPVCRQRLPETKP